MHSIAGVQTCNVFAHIQYPAELFYYTVDIIQWFVAKFLHNSMYVI